MNRKLYNELKAKVESLEKQINGGKGSGNFGHSGRPGEVGGSAPSSDGRKTSPYDYKAGSHEGRPVYMVTVPEDTGFSFSTDNKDGKLNVISSMEPQDVKDSIKALFEVGLADSDAIRYKADGYDLERANDPDYYDSFDAAGSTDVAIHHLALTVTKAIKDLQYASSNGQYGIDRFHLPDEDYRKNLSLAQQFVSNLKADKNTPAKVIKKLEDRIDVIDRAYKTISDINERTIVNPSYPHKPVDATDMFDNPKTKKQTLEEMMDMRSRNSAFTATPEQLAKTLNGGKGSGNFGHAGRPGERGGSAPDGVAPAKQAEPKGVKGGTKAEHEAIMGIVADYASGDERGLDGVFEDVEAGADPHYDHTNFQKAKRWLESGGGAVSYYDAYKTLKDLYGENFKPETYLTKGGDEDNGDWKYKDGQPYVWSIYLAKFAKAIADEMDKRENMNKNFYKELIAKIDNLAETLVKNGGKGSGNFGHAGRPGEVGGSAPSGSGGVGGGKGDSDAARYIHHDPRGKYADGFDTLDTAKEYIVDKAGDSFSGGLGEQIAMAYEDDARDFLDLPSRDKESDGAEMSMSDYADLQDRMQEVIREKSWDDLETDLDITDVKTALDYGLDKGGYEFASKNAELGQAGLSHDDAVRDLKSFIADFGISDHYGAIKAAEDGDLRTAWTNISYDMRDKLKDEYDYDPLREEYD